jgi:pentatricopeptide repeat protein
VDLLREMGSRGITPNVFCYNAAISACEKGGQWEKAGDLLREMDSRGITPDVISDSAAISAFEKGGQWETAFKLLREMGSHGIIPDVISYNAAIKACFDYKRYSEDLRLVRKAPECDLYPNFLEEDRTKWDLHDLPFATACMLLADSLLMMTLTENHHAASSGDITVVTGKGNRSGTGGPVRQTEIPLFLQGKLGLEIQSVEGNTGRFLVTQTTLQMWADSRHFDVKTMKQRKNALLEAHRCWTIDDCDLIDSMFAMDS